MLDELAFLVNGYEGVAKHRTKLKWLCYMFEVCKERPIRINGKKVKPEFLHVHLLIRLCNLHLEEFKDAVNEVLYRLRDYDEELYYFVLVATYRLADDDLCHSLQEFSLKKWQYPIELLGHNIYLDIFSVPQLPWDISPALNEEIATPDITKEGHPIEPHDICPLTSGGMLTEQYSMLLRSDGLRIAESMKYAGYSCRILCLDEECAKSALIEMFDGISSDMFQEEDGVFSLTRNCKLGRWSVARTQAAMGIEVEAANRINLSQCHHKLYDNFCMDYFDDVVEDQLELLAVCEKILSSEYIEVCCA
ncbi:hypothetical protein NECAME_07560 [Necator americanus]|uniref:Uncharacterized protein n=1 Tax=Necator americanus TaxID=51031 RepID=W2TN97_NECAM|nr:hypothetical protein NECAME_07560 [Necator americanus]ETN83144.1 hypothetical protein NECAME_07560 [Necator americanus]